MQQERYLHFTKIFTLNCVKETLSSEACQGFSSGADSAFMGAENYSSGTE